MSDHTLSGSEIKYILKEIRQNKFTLDWQSDQKFMSQTIFLQT